MKTVEITTKMRDFAVGDAITTVACKEEQLAKIVRSLTAIAVEDMTKEGHVPVLVTIVLGVEASVLVPPPTEGGAA